MSIVSRLNAEISKALAISDVREGMQANGNTPKPTTTEAFGDVIRRETARKGKVILDANKHVRQERTRGAILTVILGGIRDGLETIYHY